MKMIKEPATHDTGPRARLQDVNFFPAPIRCLLVTTLLFYTSGAFAQQVFWDPGHVESNAGFGSSNWDTTAGNTNWYNGSSDIVWSQTSTTVGTLGAVFGGTDGAYTVNVDNGQIAFTNLTINNSGYTFIGSALYAYGNPSATILVAAGKTVTFSNSMTGNNASMFFECGSNAVVNLMGGGGSAQYQFESSNASATFYLNGTFTYSVTYVDALMYQTNGSFITGGFNLGRPGSGGINSGSVNTGTWIVTGPTTTFEMNNASLNDGRGGGHGTFIISNGATAATLESPTSGQNDNFVLCDDANGGETGYLGVYGGTLNVGSANSTTGGIIELMPAGASATTAATFNQTNGTINAWGGIYFGENTSATYNTASVASVTNSGGFLYLGNVGGNGGGIAKGSFAPTNINIVLSGGTVGTLGSWSSSMPLTLGTLNGNITFQCANSNATPFNISLTGALTGSGGLNVTGGGTLTLSGPNNYTGNTSVSNGTLLVITSGSGAINGGSMTVDGSAGSPALAVQSSPGQSFSTGPLTFQNGTTTLGYSLGVLSPSASVAPIQVTGGVDFAATPTVNVSGSAIAVGTFPLITYTTSASGTPTAVNITLTGGSASGYISNIVASKTISLVVTQSTYIPADFWKVGNGTWDINTTANWYFATPSNPAIKYTNGSAVIFDDTAAGPFPITVANNVVVSPGSVTANNTLGSNYTISGTGSIAGFGILSVLGGGTLTLAETNSYNGGTILTSGQLNINSGGDNSGQDSAIGIGPLLINGGAIDNTSGSNVTLVPSIFETWSNSFTYVGSANSFNTGPGSVTLGGTISLDVSANDFIVPGSIGDNNSNFKLEKTGSGVLTLLGNNTFEGGFELFAGQVNLGTASATGTGPVTIDGGTAMDNVSGAALTLAAPNYVLAGGTFSYIGSTTNTLDFGTGTVSAGNSIPAVFVNVVSNTFETDGDLTTGNNIITKTGAGTWILGGLADGNNNLILTVNQGEVIMQKTSGYAIGNRSGGGLTVESNALVLDNGQGVAQVGNGQGVAVTLNSGIFDIYGNTETFDSLALSNAVLQNGNIGTSATLSVTNNAGFFTLAAGTSNLFNIVSNASLTIKAGISGAGSLVMSNLGELYLANSNSYTGETLVQSGAIGLTTGSISGSSDIVLASTNSVLDASQTSGQLAEVFSGQTLSGVGIVSGVLQADSGSTVSPGTAAAVGALTVASNSGASTLNGAITMRINAGTTNNDQLVLQQGSLVYGATGSLTVTNLSGTLAAGNSFQLFNAAGGYSGVFGSFSLPTLGANLAWNTAGLATNGTISVVSSGAPPSPRIVSFSHSAGNLIFSGTNGTPGGTYYVLTSTNAALRLTSWTVIATNTFDGSGNFSVTNAIGSGTRFFILGVP